MENLDFHHEHEETIFFPNMKEKYPVIDSLEDQHKEFHPLIKEIIEYVSKCKDRKDETVKYDSKKLIEMTKKLKVNNLCIQYQLSK